MQNRPPRSGARAQRIGANQSPISPGTTSLQNGGAHSAGVTQCAFSPAIDSSTGAQRWRATQLPSSPGVAVLVQLWRQRQAWHRAEKTLVLQAQARCRAFANGDKIEARKLWARALKGDHASPALAVNLEPFIWSIKEFASKRKPVEKALRKLARESACWPFIKQIKGFGDLNLAALIGECGDVAGYRNPSALWKRMGLAVINGERQRKCVDEDKALVHGYSPRRRAVTYLIADCLIKANSPVKAIYEERKARRIAEGWTPIHAHRDAARYMTKRVLRDLWVSLQVEEQKRAA
jgi:hypothetical protein